MSISLETLEIATKETKFRPEMLEKVFHLIDLLSIFFSDERIKRKIALKGGTALNLFYFKFPRLSVDIDLNYIGLGNKEVMLEERTILERNINEILLDKEFTSDRQPSEHAGGKWRLRYKSAFAGSANLEIDLNYISRVPLWDVCLLDSFPLAGREAKGVVVLDKHEIAGSKLVALFARVKSRDLFDAHQILSSKEFDKEKLRLAFLVYGAMSRKDWRTVSIEDLDFEVKELQNMLIPLLRENVFQKSKDTKQLAQKILDESKEMLEQLLPFKKAELEFLKILMEEGRVEASLISQDPSLIRKIEVQPGIQWKIKNIEKMKAG